MKKIIKRQLSLIALLVLISVVSCKKDDDEVKSDPKEVLTAKAGADQIVDLAQTVSLDGSASTSSLNKAFNYKWQFIKKPEGSNATLLNDTNVKPVFTPDRAGEYTLELTISNESGSGKDQVTITVNAAQPVILGESIDQETSLPDRIADPALPDYIVNKDIRVNAPLTLSPGVVIQFKRDTRMDINEKGSIIAKGTADHKIRFIGAELTSGYWKGIMVYSNSSANIFENVEILHAGSVATLSTYKSAVTLFGISHAYLSLKSCLISESGGYGLHAAAGSVLGDFTVNSFTKNAEAGIFLDAANVPKLDPQSVFTGANGRDVVEIMQSNLDNAGHNEEVWSGFDDHTPYRLIGDLFVKTGWKLKPGVVVEAASHVTIEIHTTAYLNAIGTSDKPIVFTGVTKMTGFWKGIRSYSTSSSNQIEYGEISYGGNSDIVSGKKANLAITGSLSVISVKNSKISGSGGYGICVAYNSSINSNVETVNTFENNVLTNVQKD